MTTAASVGTLESSETATKSLRVQRYAWPRLMAFIAPSVPVGALMIPLGLYLPPYYSGYVGLSLATVGFAFLVVRLLDIGFDPLMGLILDRTRTRWGQCRPWIVVGGTLTSVGTLMLFLAPKGTGAPYLIVGLLILYGGTSIISVAQPAWAARLVTDYHDRSRIFAWMTIAASVGTFLVLGAPTALAALTHAKPGADVHAMGWGIAIAVPVALVIALIKSSEPPPSKAHGGAEDRVHMRDYLALLRIASVRRLVIADALTTVGVGTSTSLFMFYWRSRGVTGAETSLLVLTYLAATLATVPVWMAIAKRIGKHRALIASCTGFIIVIPGMGILPANRLEILLPAIALLGMTFSGQFLIRAMAADAADAARLQTGVDRLGQVYALLSSTAKLGPALAVGMAYAILDRVGFKAAEGAANSSTAIHILALLYLGFPAVMMMFGALAFLGYKLDKAEHARVAAALDERDQVTTHPS